VKAILIKYHAVTNTRPPMFRATMFGMKSVSVDYCSDYDVLHHVHAAIKKMHLDNNVVEFAHQYDYIVAQLPNGDYCAVPA
jgi:uncharacterized protein YutD